MSARSGTPPDGTLVVMARLMAADDMAHTRQVGTLAAIRGAVGRAPSLVPTQCLMSADQAGIVRTMTRWQSAAGNTAVQALLSTQRDSSAPGALDPVAEKVVALATDTKQSEEWRAVRVTYAILNQYFPGYAARVSGVGFDNRKAGSGMMTEQQQSPDGTYYGLFWVGSTFLNSLIKDKTHLASHIIMIAHELEHIDQWRQGLAGHDKADEREFLAHYHSAIAADTPGTGAMAHTTRANYIDAALGLYNCLDARLNTKVDGVTGKKYSEIRDDLLARRPAEVAYGWRKKHPNSPAACQQPDALKD
jgi:hypothetical protein